MPSRHSLQGAGIEWQERVGDLPPVVVPDDLAAPAEPRFRPHLTLFLAVDMVDAARDNPGISPSELPERFLAWTRSPVGCQLRAWSRG
jgi:hypothetical protein